VARVLFDTGIFSVINQSSAIGVGWGLNFYTANTSTRINSYTEPSGGVANTNPVLTDADGRFSSMWLDRGQSIKWDLIDEDGAVVMSQDDYAIPTEPPSFDPALDDFLAGDEPLPIASGGTGSTSAVNAIAALGGLPAAGGTVSGNIVRSTKGVHHFWETAAMNNGNWFLTVSTDPDPTTLAGQVWAKYAP
jgi:hypothetical protein